MSNTEHYDFDALTDRTQTTSLKWDIQSGELPMWVADMDFKAAPEIRAAIQKRIDNGVFGYSIVPDAWAQSYVSWWQRRHHFTFEKESLIFCTGVVPAISSAVRKLTTVGENVLILTPVYNIFFNSIRNNGRNIIECPLSYKDGMYQIDFDRFENELRNPQTTMLLFCNPHNPVGAIWDKETLSRVGSLCKKYHVVVVSDEIHCDITDPGTEYIPFASVSEECRTNSVTCIAPTKAFNLAGIQTAAVMVSDPVLRHKMWRALNTDEVAEPNILAVHAAIAAFNHGEQWLDALREYLYQNKQLVLSYVQKQLPLLRLIPSQATYLLWFDCSAYSDDSVALCEEIRKKTGLYLSEGREYGEAGSHFFRMNIACQRSRVQDGLDRLKKALTE